MDINDREAGINAIIALQAMGGIVESREKAEKGWDAMTPREQQQTMAAYQLFGPKEKPRG